MIELEKNYDHKKCEEGKMESWYSSNFFEAYRKENRKKKPFSMIVPPPNVTGILHIGHALNCTTLDTIARYKKLNNYDVLFLPATDHAGIATQAKVEESLKKRNIDKYELGREKFLLEAYKWKDEHHDYIRKQWDALGLSMDYSKERFTLDENMSKVVNHVFKKLYDEGLIYRGERIINWDPVLKTALSDIEVNYKEDDGKFYYFKYQLEGEDDYLQVATTRPETMFGDQCLVFNPKDERYRHLLGKYVINPADKKRIPIIADEYVDISFGTGLMKCTPAHDPNDFEIAKRHDMKFVKIFTDDIKMNDNCPEKYRGLDNLTCRDMLVEDIKNDGNLIKIEDIKHNVAHSERTDCVVEPMLSKQWFVKMKPLSEAVLKVQRSKDKTRFFPKRYEKIFSSWLKKTNDWCISRQLWWGHRIPIYTDKITGEVICSEERLDEKRYLQDEDVLDTWFSSALAPFAFLNWPDDQLYKRFYPLDMMVTAYDIIFFWVERMAFDGLHFTKKMPFKKVLIHGLVRDDKGRKMSKSLGNGIDPFAVINEYGADSLRLSLLLSSTPGLDISFSMARVEKAHSFINKLWNASRYILMMVDEGFKLRPYKTSELSFVDVYILDKMNYLLKNVKKNMDKCEIGQAFEYIYNFIYDNFCGEYLEYSKVSMKEDGRKEITLLVLLDLLKKILIILFPFIPFVTETIYLSMIGNKKSIYNETYPSLSRRKLPKEDVALCSSLNEAIRCLRNFKAENSLQPNSPVDLFISDDENTKKVIPYLKRFSFAEKITEKDGEMQYHFPSFSLSIDVSNNETILQNIEKRKAFLSKEIERSRKLLSNENFINKASPEKVEKEKEKYQKYLSEYQKYQNS